MKSKSHGAFTFLLCLKNKKRVGIQLFHLMNRYDIETFFGLDT